MLDSLAAGLIVTVKDRATRVLGTIGKGFDKLKASGAKLRKGLGMIGSGLQTLAKAGLVAAAALGFMGMKAASFEEQMSAVRAVMLGASEGEINELEAKIKELGATTKFSATEAAQGAELLARAGFDAQEQISALGDVLNAAAAEGIPMATAANIIANNVRAFGLEAGEAGRVADVLAMTSARTNTSMVQLGEGMKMVSSTARQMGQSVEDTSLALGLLANAGLQGSIGGTALNTMMLKMAKLSDANKEKFNALGIQIQDLNGDMLPIPDLMENLAGGIGQIEGNLEQSAFLMDVFGIRGQKAASILATGFTDMNKVTEDGTNKFEKLRKAINEADGAAADMAEIRMKNLKGSFTLLNSAIEGLSIEFMGPVITEIAVGVKDLATAVNDFQESDFGRGFLKSAEDIAAGIKFLNDAKVAMMGMVSGGDANNEQMGRAAGIALALAAAFGVVATVAGVVLIPIIGAFMLMGEGLAIALGAVASAIPPILIGLALFAGFIVATQKEGQTFGDRLFEIFNGLKENGMAFFTSFHSAYMQFMQPALDAIMENLVQIWEAVKPVFVALSEAFGGTSEEAAGMGATLGSIFGFLANLMMVPLFIITDLLGPAIGFFVTNFLVPMIEAVGMVAKSFTGLLSGTKSFKESFVFLLKGIAGIILNTILFPFKIAIIGIMEAAAAIGAVSNKTLGNVKGFLNAEPGTLLGRDESAQAAQTAAAKATAQAHDAQKSALETGYQDPNNIMQGNLETTVKGCIENNVKVEGKNLSIAKEEHEFELSQRGGFSLTPFQQGPLIANGGLPTNAIG